MTRRAPVAALVIAMALACALLLALPAQTITTKYVNDLFIFLDGVHRVSLGQVPNRDFHTALGPLNYYLPALGYWLTGHLGGAMPVGMALVVAALAAPAAHILHSRLRSILALPVGAFLILVAAVPINLGESIGALSFAMFYNRIGWAALGLMLLMHLHPYRAGPRQVVLDAASASFLTLLMIYTKASYGAVALAFLGLMLLVPHQRRWAAAALGIVLAVGLVVEAFWHGTAAHIADLLLASRVSGGLDSIDNLASTILRNLSDYVLFGIFALLTLIRTRSWRDFLFYGFCAASGFMLINQNFQDWGIITLGAGGAVAAEQLMRDGDGADRSLPRIGAGAPLLLLALVLPTTLHNAAALGLHAGLAIARQGEAFALPRFDGVRLVRLWSDGEHPTFKRYLASLKDGAAALASLDTEPRRVLVLDFVGPFSAGLGLVPPRGDSTWHHWGRTIDETHYLPPERLLRDVEIVMDPKWPIESWTAEGLRKLYAEYLAANFELAQETADWRVYVLRTPNAVSHSRAAEPAATSRDRRSGG